MILLLIRSFDWLKRREGVLEVLIRSFLLICLNSECDSQWVSNKQTAEILTVLVF